MDRVSKKCVKTSLKLANSVMFISGIAILMYSVWLIVVCLRDYTRYPFPWFLWACIGAGSIFSFIACIGHAGASTRSNFLLSLYILFMFLLIVVESLVTADIFLNDDWDKDFPKDHTKRFDDFVDFVDSNDDTFRCLGLLIAFSQVLAFLLAMVLRTMGRSESHYRAHEDEVFSAKLPFLDHEAQHPPLPYAVGHPDPQYYYPASPYMNTDMNTHTHTHTHTYAHGYPDITCTGNEKGECIAPTVQDAAKA